VQPKEASADTEPKSEAPKEDDKPIVDADGFITVTTRRKKKPAAENTEKTA
jgi:hypothetical protein